ncbi:MAG: cation:proton antiporter [Proteobacteria bacterium]|nr:cation:proton antiporter [Pseudomonadota bacterium]
MDAFMILVAFILGFLLKQLGLPPLLGFLAAGFVLNGFGVQGGDNLQELADTGVMLLLFSIGLKVRVKSLLKPQIWAVASMHMAVVVAFLGTMVYLLSYTGLSLFSGLGWQISLLIAFALSFSSTVFTVKVLEEKGEMNSKHGQIAIGILILQDFFAVFFLTLSSGKIPSPWAVFLFGLIFLRRPILGLMNRSGHGELLILLGLLIPIAGAQLFESVGMKPDLGALLVGMLLAGHPKTNELAKAILSFKDLLLVGFFLTIGLSGMPSLSTFGVSLLLVLAVPFKIALFYLFLARFKLRARTSTLASLSLATYSEFGLIIGALAAAKGWLSSEWLIIFALSLSLTFVLASPLNSAAYSIYGMLHVFLRRFETKERLPDDRVVSPGDAEAVVFGMGRLGAAAYENLHHRYGKKVIGLDFDQQTVARHCAKGLNVIQGDATDYDFWERIQLQGSQIKVVMLAMPSFEANVYAAKRIRTITSEGTIAAIVTFDDQIELLKEAGIDLVFNVHKEAGTGFADHVCAQLGKQKL